MNGYSFTSALFKIEPREDEQINPGCYGRQLVYGSTISARGAVSRGRASGTNT